MTAHNKIKWLASMVLAGIVLILALVGGKWGTGYAAGTGIDANPIIYNVTPWGVPAGSPDKPITITGAYFGTWSNTRVRIVGDGHDQIVKLDSITSTKITVVITNTMLTAPTTYDISVIRSTLPSIPTIPLTIWDLESNLVPFEVYVGQYMYLPLVTR